MCVVPLGSTLPVSGGGGVRVRGRVFVYVCVSSVFVYVCVSSGRAVVRVLKITRRVRKGPPDTVSGGGGV